MSYTHNHHQSMALQYLYNATRSLAYATNKVDGFKLWAKGKHTIPDYLTALSGHQEGRPWPWEEGASATPLSHRERAVADIVFAAINAAGLEAHDAGDKKAEEVIEDMDTLLHAALGIPKEGTTTPGPQGARLEADKPGEPADGSGPGS